MGSLPAREIKNRGISVVDEALEEGPVHIIKNNRHAYVVLSEEDYQQMMDDLADARIAASEADIMAGRVRKGTAKGLIKETS